MCLFTVCQKPVGDERMEPVEEIAVVYSQLESKADSSQTESILKHAFMSLSIQVRGAEDSGMFKKQHKVEPIS